ncbi:MAG: hypothetical protein SXU28_14435, partial [Pseudomonadota bacterium]|nr:hypothetical protein [Pseudomonadota bacterium]
AISACAGAAAIKPVARTLLARANAYLFMGYDPSFWNRPPLLESFDRGRFGCCAMPQLLGIAPDKLNIPNGINASAPDYFLFNPII